MDALNIFHTLYKQHGLEGSMDVRVTMTLKGIKVNLGLDSYSNKPKSFDLNAAFKDSIAIAINEVSKMIIYYKDDIDRKWFYVKRKAFLEEVLSKL